MSFNFEKELSLLLKKHSDEKRPVMRDPWASKMRNHKKRKHFSFNKETKENKKLYYRRFRNKNRRCSYDAITLNFDELDNIKVPVFKKTSGWLTW